MFELCLAIILAASLLYVFEVHLAGHCQGFESELHLPESGEVCEPLTHCDFLGGALPFALAAAGTAALFESLWAGLGLWGLALGLYFALRGKVRR